MPPNFISPGGIVLHFFISNPQSKSQFEGLWLLSTGDGQLDQISKSGVSDAIVSPDGNWLAYHPWREADELWIARSLKNELITRPWKTTWRNGVYLHWFDNDWISMPSAEHSPGNLTLYNPFTDEEKQFAPKLPNLYDDRISYYLHDFVLYNQSLSHVLYIAITRETGRMLILRDLEQEREVWRLAHLNAFRFPATWNPDGTYLAIAGEVNEVDPYHDNFEIIGVDLQGQASQLTNFSHTYDIVSIGMSLSWSPDGRYLAFWLRNPTSIEDTIPFRLHVLDMQTGETTDTCLLGGVGGPLLWSPDSRQIAFQNGDWMQPTTLVVLDVVDDRAVRVLSESVSLIGWTNWGGATTQ